LAINSLSASKTLETSFLPSPVFSEMDPKISPLVAARALAALAGAALGVGAGAGAAFALGAVFLARVLSISWFLEVSERTVRASTSSKVITRLFSLRSED
jgi:hypothetical protein